MRTSDTPAFCGNRVGFKVLNECAQLADEHGAAYIDALLGPHTGRAMAPLATIDFVGWDVHQAIVDNVYAQHAATRRTPRSRCRAYMQRADRAGCLGDKTPTRAASSRRATSSAVERTATAKIEVPEVARKMKALHHVGRYREAFDVFAEATRRRRRADAPA